MSENEEFRRRKLQHLRGGTFQDPDFFPWLYCPVYYRKVDWPEKMKGNSWSEVVWKWGSRTGKRSSLNPITWRQWRPPLITPDSFARAHPEVIATSLNTGESVLLHIGTKTYFRLSETGSRVWDLMSEGLTMSEIGNPLEAEFEVTTDKAKESVITLTQALADEKLVQDPEA